MKNEILTACHQLLAAALDGTYQGIVLTVLVAVSLRMLRRTNAATRYAVWFGTLLLLALVIPAHYARNRWDIRARPHTIQTPVSVAVQPDPDDMRMEPGAPPLEFDSRFEYFAADFDNPLSPPNDNSFDVSSPPDQQNAALAATDGTQAPEDPVRPLVRALRQAADQSQIEQSTSPEAGYLPVINQKLGWLGERLLTPFPSWKITSHAALFVAAIFPILWLAIAGVKLSLLIWQLLRIRKLKSNAAEPRPELNALFLSLRESLAVRRNVTLKVSSDQRSPVVLGFFKPIVLLPSDAGLEASEHVLRHELAHVRRYDDWANLIQHSIKALLFFHPAVWWVSKRISLEREIACDDQVLQSMRRPKAYALLLADLAARIQPTLLAPGVSTNQSQLKQRIDMILNTNRNTSPRLAKGKLGLLATATALLAAAAMYSAPRLIFAQSAEIAPAPPAAGLAPGAPGPVASLAPAALAGVSEDAPALVADTPAALPTPPVASGPKFKPGNAISVEVHPVVTPRPSIAIMTPPSPGAAPAAMTLLAPPVPAAPLIASADTLPEPRQPETPRPARRPARDPSLEDRLDRLEKMVESLVAQQKGNFEFAPKTPPGATKLRNFPEAGKQWEQAQADYAKKMAEFDMKRTEAEKRYADVQNQRNKELAEQHARMAVDQAKVAERAAREAQRASRDAQRGRTVFKSRDGSHQELEALHKQRETLQKQMEKLDRQIEKLERDQEQLDEQRESDEQNLDVQEDQSAPDYYRDAKPSGEAAPSADKPQKF